MSVSSDNYYGLSGAGWYLTGAICYTKNDNTKTWENISVFLNINPINSPSLTLNQLYSCDLNNDGLNDLIVTDNTRNYQLFNSRYLDIGTYYSVDFLCNGLLISNFNGSTINIPGDFDGDGLADFLSINQSGVSGSVSLNNNNSFTGFDVSAGNSSYDIYNEDHLVTDFNHDGKSDLILVNSFRNFNDVFVKVVVNWFASTGSGFTLAYTVTSTDKNYSFRKYNCLGDFDGDGREDVLSYGSNIYKIGNKSDNVFIQRSFNTNFEANQIKTITDGMGKTTGINYQPLTYTITPDNKTFYSKGSGSVYPVADIQKPVYCVSKVTEPNGQGGISTTDFSYAQAKEELTGRGFLGFMNRTISNETTNRKIVSTTDMDLTYFMPQSETTEISTTGNTALSKSQSFYTNSKSGKIFLSQPLQSVEHDYLNDVSKTTDYLLFDAVGNLNSLKTTQGDLITTQTISYIQKGSFCLNKPENITVTGVQGSDTYTRSMSNTYDNNGNLTKVLTDPDDANKKTVEYKEWTAFGQPTRTEVSANGKTRFSTITISTGGRFIESKTDVLGQTIQYNWNATTGLLDTETSRLGTTTYTYNGMGQLTRTDYADGTFKETTSHWATTGNAYGAKFYVTQAASGISATTGWFDALQRPVAAEANGLNGNISRVFTQFRADGRTDKVSAPTFGSVPTAWDAVYDYYTDGRVHTVATPTGTSTTTYNGKTTTVTTPESVKTSVLNSAGQLVSSTVNGKTVTYTYYASGKANTATPEGGQTVTMQYDLQGNRTSLTDPDAGVTTTYYNGLGELRTETITNNSTQGPITTTYNYNDVTGLLESRVRNTETTNYGYDNLKRLETVEIAGQHKQTYGYGSFDRVETLTELINGTKTLVKVLGYDDFGRVNKETFPTGYYVENHYDDYGNMYEVTDKYSRSIWQATEANARGQLTKVLKGVKETVYGYDDSKGQLTSITASGVVNYSYWYDAKNNLDFRTDNMINQKEKFTYDTQNRLTNWDIRNTATDALLKPNNLGYDALTGNIISKSDLGNFTLSYGGKRPDNSDIGTHALATISGVPTNFPTADLNVTYTDFRKIKTLNENAKNYTLTYGVDDQRRMSVQTQGTASLTKYYMGDYEEESDNLGNVKKIHYLSGGAVMINSNGVETLYYGYTDNLGSLIALTDVNGNVVEKYAYDPWGARRNPTDWRLAYTRSSFITNRGYTGHEQLDAFGIINMNGRVYDPLTAMFFSPDPLVSSPGDWLDYNRYSYVMNNPFRYTDPSGYRPAPNEFENEGLGGGGNTIQLNGRYNFGYNPYNFAATNYHYNGNGLYINGYGNEVSWGEVNDNYVVPNAWLNAYGQYAGNVYSSIRYGDANTNTQLANINASANDYIAGFTSAMDLMITGSKMFVESNNVGNFTYITVNGTESLLNTGTILKGLEIAAKGTFVLSVIVDAGFAMSGNKEAQRYLLSNTIIGYIALTAGPTGIVIGLTYLVLKESGAFKDRPFLDRKYTPNNYAPQDGIKNYRPMDSYKTIYINH